MSIRRSKRQAPVVQTLDSAIHWINDYPLDNSIGFASVYPLDSDLSAEQRYHRLNNWSQDDNGNENVTNLHIWRQKITVLHALHVHSLFFFISSTFLSFLRREMTCFAVFWTTFCSIFSCNLKSAGSNINSRMVRTHFASIMALNNCEITFSDKVLAAVDVVFG